MDSQEFWGVLKARGLTFFSGVPDSTFGDAYNHMVNDPEIRYVPAVREDVALGVASAAFFAQLLDLLWGDIHLTKNLIKIGDSVPLF